MIHELRVYRVLPGRMPNLLARFRDHTVPIWERHGIRPLGFWTTAVGESNNDLTYIIPWESLAEREAKCTAFVNDPAWHKAPGRERAGRPDRRNHPQRDAHPDSVLGAEIG